MPVPSESPSDVAGILSRTVDAVLAGALAEARRVAVSIDSDEKWTEKRKAKRAADAAERSSGIIVNTIPDRKRRDPSLKVRLQIQSDDHYRCRYAHCRRRTVDQRVVEALSRLVPDEVLPYHRNWGKKTTHGLVWTDLATIEHVLPWSMGGTNDRANLVTVCTCCQYAKMQRTPAQLGWSVCAASGDDDGWDGLVSTLGRLEELANAVVTSAHGKERSVAALEAASSSRRSSGHNSIAASDIAVGDHISVTPPEDRVRTPFRVDAVRADALDLVYIWRDNRAGVWAESRTTRTLLTADLDNALLVSHDAPHSGDPIS